MEARLVISERETRHIIMHVGLNEWQVVNFLLLLRQRI